MSERERIKRTDPARRQAELIEIWRCRKSGHFDCWSSSHLLGAEVMVEAMTHAPSCDCWRHWVTGQEGLGIVA